MTIRGRTRSYQRLHDRFLAPVRAAAPERWEAQAAAGAALPKAEATALAESTFGLVLDGDGAPDLPASR